jgi:hypothetical protein
MLLRKRKRGGGNLITEIKERFVFVVFLFAVIVLGGDAQEKYHKLKSTDLSFVEQTSKISIGISDKIENIMILGSASRKLKSEGSDPAWNIWRYSFKGLTVDAFEGNGSINFMEINNGDFLSSRGIKLGDSREKIIQLYGEPDVDQKNVIGYLYLTEDSVWGLDFYFDNIGVNRMVVGRDD